jgi:hypothetical protein
MFRKPRGDGRPICKPLPNLASSTPMRELWREMAGEARERPAAANSPAAAESSEDITGEEPEMDDDPAPLPPGVLGYVVVLSGDLGRGFLPDTDLRSREAAQRQVDSWNKTLTFRGRAVLCEVRAAGEGG